MLLAYTGLQRGPASAVVPTCVPNPQYEDDILLLHGDGANGGATFTDSSTYNRTMAISAGSPVTSTAQKKFGSASIYGGSGSPQITTSRAGSEWNCDNWTWQCWYRRAADGNYHGLAYFSGNLNIFLRTPSNSGTYQLAIVFNSFLFLTSISSTAIGQWAHLAVSVSKAGQTYTVRIFFNGVLEAQTTTNNSNMSLIAGASPAFSIGRANSGGFAGLNGYVDEYRLTPECLYTGDFNPETLPFCDGPGSGGDTTPIPAPAPPPTPQPPAPQPITFAASVVATLSGIIGDAIASTTLATITCADAAMTISLSETVPGLTFDYTANVLTVSGTPTAPGGAHRVVVSYIASDGSYSIRGSTEHTINIADAAVPFLVGDCASASGRVGQPLDVILCEPEIAANVPSVLVSADRYFPPGLLSWVWSPGASSAGVLRMVGTPEVGAIFSGTLTVTYRTAGWPQEVLGTSTHQIDIVAAYVAPSPPPAPAPAPPAPPPAAPPPPPPASAPGNGSDPFLSSVKLLQRFNQADQQFAEVALQGVGPMTGSGQIVTITTQLATGRTETGERIVSVQEIRPQPYRGNSYTWDERASRILNVITADGFAFGDGANASIFYTSRLIAGFGSAIGPALSGGTEAAVGAVGEAALFRDVFDRLECQITGADGADGNLAVECMVDIGATAWAALAAAGSDQRLCPVLTLVDNAGAAVWMLGLVRSAGVILPVFWRKVTGSPTGSFVVSFAPLTWRPGRFVHLAFCSAASGSAAATAGWFDGQAADGGNVTLSTLVPAPASRLLVGGPVPLIEWVVNTGRSSTFIPFTGAVDEIRITAAARYASYMSPAATLIPAARVIPWPNY